jgi:hypothetical protein
MHMLHFHATQKLLNTCRIQPLMYVSNASPGQRLHNWYVVLCGSGFTGKFLLLYIHEPSLLTVVVKGKTIASTIDNFRTQLEQLLYRHRFPKTFIEKEMSFTHEYVVGKTNNKTILGHINQMVIQVTGYNVRYRNYDEIDTTVHEDIFMDWMYKSKGVKTYQTPKNYWADVIADHRPL